MLLDIKIKVKGEFAFPCNVIVRFRREYDIGYNYHIPNRVFKNMTDILKYLAENIESDFIDIKVEPVKCNTNRY